MKLILIERSYEMKDFESTNSLKNIDFQSVQYDLKILNYLIEEIEINKKSINFEILKKDLELMTYTFLVDSLLSRIQRISDDLDDKLSDLNCN